MRPEMVDAGDHEVVLSVEDVPEPVMVLDEAARIVSVNTRLLRLTGYTRSDLCGRSTRILCPAVAEPPAAPHPQAGRGDRFMGSVATDVPVTVSHRDGSSFAARLDSASAWSRQHGAVQVVRVRDEVRLSLDQIGLTQMLDSAPEATLILTPQWRIALANQRAAALVGRARDDLTGLNVAALLPPKHTARGVSRLRERYEDALHRGDLAGEVTTLTLQVRRPDGRDVPVEVTATAVQLAEGRLLRLALRDISERFRLREASDRLRSDFLATVSHELRTPLASIIGYAELLDDLDDADLSDRARHLVEVISRNARRQLRLVEDLLTAVVISGTGLDLRATNVELCDVVNRSVTALQPSATAADVQVVVDTKASEIWMWGEAVRLGQTVENLLTNAIKFSPTGATVTIGVTERDRSVHLRVCDHGPGIPAHELPHVFETFHRGARAAANETPGPGLGLRSSMQS